ncbi:MAG: alpha/beta hydrolase, partial [Acinetobacter sp.]|uniref:alpha/beta hydrolase n=1 Tax=Acinetobacter sp. TaxID=472 RepID=UPI0019C83E44
MNGSKQHIYIVHGYQASPNDHWFPWLGQKLSQMDLHAEVKRLVLPHSDAPHFEEWQQALALQMTTLDE